MDFELQHMKLEGYQLFLDTVLTQEETIDSIIPDAFPDAARVICADGSGYLMSKQAGEGTIRINGAACVNVLYKPENGDYVRSVPVSIPFQCVSDSNQFSDNTLIHADVLAVCAEARLVNPRKLFVKAEMRVRLIAYNYVVRDVVCDLATQTGKALQKKCGEYKDHTISAVLEKPFSFSDVLHQSGSKPPMDELMCWTMDPGMVEAKYIGKKLITKGELILSVCYRSEHQVVSTKFELPFSQIIDVDGNFEEGEPHAIVTVKNVICGLLNGELEISVDAVLQAALWSWRKVMMLGDAYSTDVLLDTERVNCAICTEAEQMVRRENCRKFCESAIPAKQVIRCAAHLSPLISQWRENSLQYSGTVEVSVLYLTEDDALCNAEYTIPVTCGVEIKKDEGCTCSGRPVGEVVAVPVTGGFEVRAEVEFTLRVTAYQTIPNVVTIRKSSVAQSNERRPSVILRMVNREDDLWEIAKSCSSTVDDICAANQLSGQTPEPGSILLIPVHR